MPGLPPSSNRRLLPLLLLCLLAITGGSSCAARMAYRKGQAEARKGNWDMAVARITTALQKDPGNIAYRIALENARIQASRQHYELGRKYLAAGDLDKAVQELEIASNFDVSNKSASDDLQIVRDRIRFREDEKRRLTDYATIKSQADAAPLPVPVLSPRSPVPISLKLHQPLQKVFEVLSKLSGVNILVDQDFRDKPADVNLTGVTFEQALDQILFTNRLFYVVLDQNTILISPDTPASRRRYENVLLRTFYLENADLKEMETILKVALGTLPKIVSNPTLSAINVIARPDELALAQRLVALNDKARGEVMIELEILEVSREKIRDYGIKLSSYTGGVSFSPTDNTPVTDGSSQSLRGYLLSSLNLADFIVTIPRGLLLSLVSTGSNGRILAAPRLRAAEGKKTTLKIGQEVPVPVTTFQATNTGGGTFTPATSFQYRNVGVNMDITPRVNPTGDILLEMNAEFSLLGPQSGDLPTFLTRQVTGVLRVRDGETSLIGGLLQTSETEAFASALGLENVPVLRRIFPGSKKTKTDSEILISITPHLLRGPKVIESDLTALGIGTMENTRVAGARAPLLGSEPAPARAPAGPGGSVRAPSAAATPAPPAPAPYSPMLPTVAPSPAPSSAPPSPPPPVPPGALSPPGSDVPRPGSDVPRPAAAAAPAAAATAGGTSVTLGPPTSTIEAGQTSPVGLVAMDAQGLTEVELVLSYDPAVVEAVDAEPGPLLTLGGVPVATEKERESGRMRAHFSRATGVSGSGVVATVTLRGVAPGSTAVETQLVQLVTRPGGATSVTAAPVRVEVTP